jgi:hypothetical protein
MDNDYISWWIAAAYNDATKARQMPSNGVLYDANDGGTSLSLPADLYEPGVSDFLVNVNGNGDEWTVNVAKGTVLYRSSPNNLSGGCLREYLVRGFGVWPSESLSDGDYSDSPWVQKGGFCTISPASEGGSNQYGVYLIANQYKICENSLEPGVPYLALMPLGGDAETKTKPWGNEDGCDLQRWFNFFEYKAITVETPVSPFEVSGNLEHSQQAKLESYNCQRIRLALITWDTTSLVWSVTQYAAGTITIPYNIHFCGAYRFEITDPPTDYPSWYTTPYFLSAQNSWEGAFTDCEKWDGTGISPTTQLDL